jgi:signal transduction histidine kinase
MTDDRPNVKASDSLGLDEPAPASIDGAAAAHKNHTKRIVNPVMGVASILFYMAFFRADLVSAVMAVGGVLSSCLNAYVTSGAPKLRVLGRAFNLRSDFSDAVRWVLNLVVYDVALLLVLRPDPAAGVIIWIVMLLAAQADLFRSRHRRWVLGLGLASGAGVFWYLSPGLGSMARLFTISGMAAICFLFERLETFWTAEYVERLGLEVNAAQTRVRLELMERDAQLGSQARIISHELANMIMIIDISAKAPERLDFNRIRRSVDVIKRINALVLNDRRMEAKVATRTIDDIMQDFNVLVRKDVIGEKVELEVMISPEVAALTVRERFGSLFLVLRNLVRNAVDACKAAGVEAPRIRVVGEGTPSAVILHVTDNGCGMSTETAEKLLAGVGTTTKASGHGLGFRFVVDECKRNNVGLGIQSAVGSGTTISLTIPLVSPATKSAQAA